MKKQLLLVLLSAFLFVGCDISNDDMPTIEIVKLYVNDDETNYFDKIDKLPVLAVGDELSIELDLKGKKVDLSRFAIQEGRESLQEGEEPKDKLFTISVEFNEDEVSNTISKPEEGTLAFKDGIGSANLKIKATITDVADSAAILFYLSSKGHSEAAKTEIALKLLNNDTPTILITELYLNNNDKDNYCDNPKELPILNIGDELYFKIKLNGNGYHLNSFLVYEKENELLSIEIAEYNEDIIYTLEDIEKGILSFRDDVFRTSFIVKAKVTSVTSIKTLLSFELFSQSSNKEGTKKTMDLVLEKG
ncbi:hypothetical protein EZS27_031556 [termite gut metagenome]|uniref:Uncharacterized protein n=1 Tax=termite gut metagenome TaxID=433724 RepID=A0A5J4QBV0_9ZZZZ